MQSVRRGPEPRTLPSRADSRSRVKARRTPRVLSAALACVLASAGLCATASAQDLEFSPTVDLTSNAPYKLVGGTATLTATAQFIDIPATPAHYIRIYDDATGTALATCNANTCPVTVTKNQAMTRKYCAYIARLGNGYPPPDVEAKSCMDQKWSSTIVLNVDKLALHEGEKATLTAESSGTAAQSAWIRITDAETNEVIKVCPFALTCSAQVSAIAGTRTFYALQNWWPFGFGNSPQSQQWRVSNQVSPFWIPTPD